MPAEDRDRRFENALARHLRADAAGNSACLDPELLAAYHERMLVPDEMNVAKRHLVSCARCQEILGQLEATENVQALQNVETNFVVVQAASRSSAGDAVEEASSMPAAAPVALEPKSRIASFPPRKNLLLRWAVPAGAIAAGLLLWIGAREFRAPAKSAVQSSQIADNRPQSSGDLDGAPALPQLAEKEKAEYSRSEAYVARSVAPPAAEPRDELKNSRSAGNLSDRLRADRKAAPPVSMGLSRLSSAPAPAKGRGEGAGSAPADAGVAGGNVAAKTDQAQRSSQAIEVQSEQSQVVLQQNEINQQAIGDARAAAPPPPPAPANEKQTTIVTAQAPVPTLEMKDSNQPAALSKAFYNLPALPSIVMAPDGKSLWRFGASGAVMHSSDSGRTWQPQSSGVTATLTIGSAPSDNVCWIAGTAGTLLFTKDGGKHWKVITSPIAGDLGGVRATDAKHASIWDLPNRVAYETSDGGTTWKESANE
jgi:photosynthesis system II assembly factor YCF48-like protein